MLRARRDIGEGCRGRGAVWDGSGPGDHKKGARRGRGCHCKSLSRALGLVVSLLRLPGSLVCALGLYWEPCRSSWDRFRVSLPSKYELSFNMFQKNTQDAKSVCLAIVLTVLELISASCLSSYRDAFGSGTGLICGIPFWTHLRLAVICIVSASYAFVVA